MLNSSLLELWKNNDNSGFGSGTWSRCLIKVWGQGFRVWRLGRSKKSVLSSSPSSRLIPKTPP